MLTKVNGAPLSFYFYTFPIRAIFKALPIFPQHVKKHIFDASQKLFT